MGTMEKAMMIDQAAKEAAKKLTGGMASGKFQDPRRKILNDDKIKLNIGVIELNFDPETGRWDEQGQHKIDLHPYHSSYA